MDIVRTGIVLLEKHGLLKVDKISGGLVVLDIGRISSQYYVTHATVSKYLEHMKSWMCDVDLLRLFALADEFKAVHVRDEEKSELGRIFSRVPIPVKDAAYHSRTKIILLLQVFISRLSMRGHAIESDMYFIINCARRLFRGILAIALIRRSSILVSKALKFCKLVTWRLWFTQSSLRQLGSVPEGLVGRVERLNVDVDTLNQLSFVELSEVLGSRRLAVSVYLLLRLLPRYEVVAQVLPVSGVVVEMSIDVMYDFTWDVSIHGVSEFLWVVVEDTDSEVLLHYVSFFYDTITAKSGSGCSCLLSVNVPFYPYVYVKVVSDRWLHCETTLPVSFRNVVLPEDGVTRSDYMEIQPISLGSLLDASFNRVFVGRLNRFNYVQSQTFCIVYHSDFNVFLSAPCNVGKSTCSELAILRMVNNSVCPQGFVKCVCVTSCSGRGVHLYRDWSSIFGSVLGLSVTLLNGEYNYDLSRFKVGNIVVSLSSNWDTVSRRWGMREGVRKARLYVLQDFQQMTEDIGHLLEIVTTRLLFVLPMHHFRSCRIIFMGSPLSNGMQVARWCRVDSRARYFFSHTSRLGCSDVTIKCSSLSGLFVDGSVLSTDLYGVLLSRCIKVGREGIVFASNIVQARSISLDVLTRVASDGLSLQGRSPFVGLGIVSYVAKDPTLKFCLFSGVGYLYETQNSGERSLVQYLYKRRFLRVVVSTFGTCRVLRLSTSLLLIYLSHTGVVDMVSLNNVAYMLGRSQNSCLDGVSLCVLICHSDIRGYFDKFLLQPIPVESFIDRNLHEHLISSLVSGTVSRRQEAVNFLTWTFYYRRIFVNPNFYGMKGRSSHVVSLQVSRLVESTIDSLMRAGCVLLGDDGDDLYPADLGRIASFYNIRFRTIATFHSFPESIDREVLMESLCASLEFQELCIRTCDSENISLLCRHMRSSSIHEMVNDRQLKTFVLLRAHLSRVRLTGYLLFELSAIVNASCKVLASIADFLGSSGKKVPMLVSIELTQMIVQGMWSVFSELLQVPHLDGNFVRGLFQKRGIRSIEELLRQDRVSRMEIFKGISQCALLDIALFCNRYPRPFVSADVRSNSKKNKCYIRVNFLHDWDVQHSGPMSQVACARFLQPKSECW